jgi:hypothetical protein
LVSEGDELPSPSTVVRYVGLNQMEHIDGNLLGPLPTAFEGRPTDDSLSVTWCEFFDGDADQQLRCAVESIRGSMNVKPKACFCVARTDHLMAAGATFGRTPRAVYLPVPGNAAHAGVYDVAPVDLAAVTEEELKLLSLLAEQAWSRFLTREMVDAMPLKECRKSPDVA